MSEEKRSTKKFRSSPARRIANYNDESINFYSEVFWDTPSPNSRSVGGKSKSLKSSNQLLQTPKNRYKKKYFSSPVLIPRALLSDSDDEEQKEAKKIAEKKMIDELERQLKDDNYMPDIMISVNDENLDNSITSIFNNPHYVGRNVPVRLSKQKTEPLEIDDLSYSDSDFLAEFEKEEKNILQAEKTQKKMNSVIENIQNIENINSNTMRGSDIKVMKIEKMNVDLPKSSSKDSNSNKYFSSDSDDDNIIATIPIEILSGQTFKQKPITSQVPSTSKNNNTRSVNSNAKNLVHYSVIPVKIDSNNVNSSTSNMVQLNQNSAIQSDLKPKTKVCTSEEIAEKRRQAILRRKAFLEKLHPQHNKPPYGKK